MLGSGGAGSYLILSHRSEHNRRSPQNQNRRLRRQAINDDEDLGAWNADDCQLVVFPRAVRD